MSEDWHIFQQKRKNFICLVKGFLKKKKITIFADYNT